MHTPLLIDQLAELAGQRNRAALDGCFLDLFADLLLSSAVAIYRPVGDAEPICWCRLSRSTAEPGQIERATCSALPWHEQAWHTGQVVVHPGAGSRVLVPMGSHDEMHCLVEVRTAQPLREEQLRTVRGVQRFYAHLRELLDENERDSLTRLLNRKSFDETFVRMAMQMDVEMAPVGIDGDRRHPTAAAPCWLAVVDIDHFKRVNDTHGHLIGDEVLILVAQLMRRTFRGDDRLYRFGGEEFVILLRAGPEGDVAGVFERLRQGIERFDFPRVGALTVSIGYTGVLPSDTPSAAFERADQAVYHAKSHGRNQVVGYDSLIGSGQAAAAAPMAEVEFF